MCYQMFFDLLIKDLPLELGFSLNQIICIVICKILRKCFKITTAEKLENYFGGLNSLILFCKIILSS